MSARRRLGEERLYYSPPALRRINQQQQQKQEQHQQELNSKSPISYTSTSTSVLGRRKSESGSDKKTNLDRFLEHTIPFVPAQHFPRTSMRSLRNRDGDFNPYFILGDLWEFFREWSAYGAAVPLVLNESDAVVQYYVPFLSGIQLFVDPSKPMMEQRRPGEESDGNSSRETSSDGDSECGTDRVANNATGPRNHQNTVVRGDNQYAGRHNAFVGSSIYGSDVTFPPGLLIFEYFEGAVPFHREPFADKACPMSILASHFPDLKTLKSCELTSSSWISVAWYPIYRIPVGPTLQNVDACFLTFHSLAKPVKCESVQDSGSKLSLPTFGLVSYKFKVSEWNNSGAFGNQKISSLLQAAENWLRLMQVDLPDYTHFTKNKR
ncbi:hypothetical protein F511_05283 [Dorcoceras hygrometricum]|uniref:Uncharacterized protein n=1 Tax=Dorcoceras hygrometricum TaxID=472368 RepID=A0A2Z7ASE4_9LAMI|nr:hypothetical protein F511_05283 [Dorcoceras hygrometricum]